MGLVLTSASVLTSAASAQTLEGRLLHADADAAIPGADIRLINEQGQVLTRTTSADDGAFVLTAARAGRFRITAEVLGYAAVTSEPVDVPLNDTVRVELRLGRDPIALPSLTVLTERRTVNEVLARRRFYENRDLYEVKMGTGRFFTPEALDSLRSPPLTRVVQGLPGFRVVSLGGSRSDIRARNGRRPTLFINGTRVRLRDDTFDQLIAAGDIGAVEVYWGANPYFTAGPVIAVWVRTW